MSNVAIAWFDDVGYATLSNQKPFPADRFTQWTPRNAPIGPIATGLGTGDLFRYAFRTDNIVSLELAAIPQSQMELMLRLQLHLMNGGVATLLNTSVHPSYARFPVVSLAEGTVPEIRFTDTTNLEYSFVATLKGRPAQTGCGSPVGGFSPDMVSGMALWVEPCSIVVPGSLGDPISTWRDLSGNGDLAGASDQPDYLFDSGSGGGKLPHFDTVYHLQTSNTTTDLSGDSTIFAIAKYQRGADGAVSPILIKDSGVLGSMGEYGFWFDGVNGVHVGRPESADAGISSLATNYDTYHLWRATIRGTAVSYFRDGIPAGTSTLAHGTRRTTPIKIGYPNIAFGSSGHGWGFKGYMKAILLYNEAVSDSDAASVEGYMNAIVVPP